MGDEDEMIEQQIQEKGLTAPRVTRQQIEECIVAEYSFTASDAVNDDMPRDEAYAPLRRLTFVVLVLRNGFTVTGESACVSADNFDAGIGVQIARKHAVDKIWLLEGYALADRLYQQVQPMQAPE